ncbi:hypothetical protein BX616_005348 [Lobosporangium transversale]|uniref:Uncharacterized protein n=1 Tax=Lobosporangium transversale TaxID=64571 RepID=A0A1Y2GIZ5_9FUNG|nr:hypothetical protein BCR41DRAFT_423327 [Lobosporangium transversale]KAF9915795.1 hypothetical protein BX616_005348 [Lobosporangium transversale]ORZ12141.1 hypothetical protein BCR41DRAFT_423327 [Lobosporangium transversale]|eukprot:XP_021880006.1 hypothetical protein BCR41DRAFT_423327 [Lobosporangium transversale]
MLCPVDLIPILARALLYGFLVGLVLPLAVDKRENIVYVTVTEFRYLPIAAQATVPPLQAVSIATSQPKSPVQHHAHPAPDSPYAQLSASFVSSSPVRAPAAMPMDVQSSMVSVVSHDIPKPAVVPAFATTYSTQHADSHVEPFTADAPFTHASVSGPAPKPVIAYSASSYVPNTAPVTDVIDNIPSSNIRAPARLPYIAHAAQHDTSIIHVTPVPITIPADSSSIASPLATPYAIPAANTPAIASVSHVPEPYVLPKASPVISAWYPPPKDMLTYTSYAGLLSTMAPSFYPTLSRDVPASPDSPISTMSPPTFIQTLPISKASTVDISPTRASSLALSPVPTYTKAPETSSLHRSSSILSSMPVTSMIEQAEAATATSSSLAPQPTDTAIRETMSDLSAISTQKSDSATETSAETSTEATISTTTTTRGDSTQTTTFVGSDGTTTILTQYPTSRTRTSINTSGPQLGGSSRGHLAPRHGGEPPLGFATQLMATASGFCVAMVAVVTGALILPGAMFIVA